MKHRINQQFWKRLSDLVALAALALALSIPAVGNASADSAARTSPQDIIQQTSDRLLEILRAERERLEAEPTYAYKIANEVVVPHMDFDRASAQVLGRHWDRATTEQKQRFMDEFRWLLIRTYSTAVNQFSEWSLRHIPMEVPDNAKDVVVRVEVLQGGAPPIPVDYRMVLGDQGWKIYDVIVDGVSLVTTYRNSFGRAIRRGGLDALIARLSSMNEQRLRQAKSNAPAESTSN